MCLIILAVFWLSSTHDPFAFERTFRFSYNGALPFFVIAFVVESRPNPSFYQADVPVPYSSTAR